VFKTPITLKGDDILMEDRVIAVADVLEVMLSGRPHRPVPRVEAAMSEIATGKGTLCDADAVDACIRLFGESKFEFGKVETHLPPKSDPSVV
jgi:HD-GYP domain-containing protein (c-di-GMP phosphodiesterase class II)